jgi:hypothetical protein
MLSMKVQLDVIKKSDLKNMEGEENLITVIENFEMKFIWI